MRTIIILAVIGLVAGLPWSGSSAEAGPKLAPELKGLERFLGDWIASTTNAAGVVERTSYHMEVEAGGKAALLRGASRDGARNTGLWFFDPATKKITNRGVNSQGDAWTRVYPQGMHEEEFTNEFTFAAADGHQGTATETVKWLDADTWVLSISDIVMEGKPVGGPAPMTFHRMKKGRPASKLE